MKETRRFVMHPKLLLDVIRKQAGTLAKAVMEGAMNAVDAGATRFDVTVDETALIMEDNGKGFRSKEEVETFFEVFGQPHEEGDAHYGKFRMGRGQIFSFGHNFWRTGTWSMTVDVMKKGLEYKLEEMKRDAQGCKILVTLYEPLSRIGLQDVRREVARGLKYLEIPVFWHQDDQEDRISVDRTDAKWDFKDDRCLISFKESGTLDVYNMGVFVRGFDRWQFGTGGTVVSTKELDVNFARNDILSSCSIWKKVKKIVDQRASDEIRSKPLDDAARQRLAMSLSRSEEAGVYEKLRNQRIITDCRGKHVTLQSFVNKVRRGPVSVANRGDRTGDRVMTTGVAYVISQETLDRFEVSDVQALCDLVNRGGGPGVTAIYHKLKDLSEKLLNDTSIVPESELRPRERLWIRLANRFSQGYGRYSRIYPPMLLKEAEEMGYHKTRKIKVGIADGYDGWTDGSSYIAINRDFLKNLSYSRIGDIVKLGGLLLHELCHNGDSQEVSAHGPEFYERFHDQRCLLEEFTSTVFANLERDVQQEMKKTNRNLNSLLDKKDAAILAGEAFEDVDRQVANAKRWNTKVDTAAAESKIAAAEVIGKQPKKKARRTANLNVFKA